MEEAEKRMQKLAKTPLQNTIMGVAQGAMSLTMGLMSLNSAL
jgi:hypothetical protein